jgi:hypothetical protein
MEQQSHVFGDGHCHGLCVGTDVNLAARSVHAWDEKGSCGPVVFLLVSQALLASHCQSSTSSLFAFTVHIFGLF